MKKKLQKQEKYYKEQKFADSFKIGKIEMR